MYTVNFDKYFDLISWDCIYWGIRKQLIEPENAVIYANKIIENNPDGDTLEIIELLIIGKADKESVLPLIERMFSDKKDLEKKKSSALRMLRLILLLEIKETAIDNQGLLDEAEKIYADFDYPLDMECFISYMPVRDDKYDVSKHSLQENLQRLADKFNMFADREFKALVPNL